MTPSTSRKLLVSLLPAALAIALGACAPKPAEPATPEPSATPAETTPADTAATGSPPTATDAAPDLAAACNPDAVQALVGQEATEAVLEQARTGSGANTVRALKPGEPATMDFRPDRLDVALDENGIIQSLRCG